MNARSRRRKPVDASLPVTTMNRTLAVAWTTILLSGVPNDGHAQPIADKPEFRPGDSWFFHRTDTKDDKFDKWRLRVEAIESTERIATKINNREVFCDSALNPLRGGRDDAARLLVRYRCAWVTSGRFRSISSTRALSSLVTPRLQLMNR